jgi:hypothetical protein
MTTLRDALHTLAGLLILAALVLGRPRPAPARVRSAYPYRPSAN